jgi:hypothetical protein
MYKWSSYPEFQPGCCLPIDLIYYRSVTHGRRGSQTIGEVYCGIIYQSGLRGFQ